MNKKSNDLKTIFVTFSNNDYFSVTALVDRSRLLQNKLSNLTISDNEYYMFSLEYKTSNDEWEADNILWIYDTFNKLLKKKKWKKLINYCEIENINATQFIQQLKYNRKSILSLLKSLKTEYNIDIEYIKKQMKERI